MTAYVGPLPDETTILKFRHLLEAHGLGEGLFEAINAHLADEGHSLRRGTILDASIVDAPSSPKNARRERDPEMHQTEKGNQWYFGMKAHIGVESGLALDCSLWSASWDRSTRRGGQGKMTPNRAHRTYREVPFSA